MSIQNLIKLNEFVAEGFLMNDIISLIKGGSRTINENEEKILLNAKNYITLIENGQKIVSEEKLVDNLEKSLNAYNIALIALKNHDQKINLIKFDEILKDSKKQLNDTLNLRKIKLENMNNLILLFKSIRKYILAEANKLSNPEGFITF